MGLKRGRVVKVDLSWFASVLERMAGEFASVLERMAGEDEGEVEIGDEFREEFDSVSEDVAEEIASELLKEAGSHARSLSRFRLGFEKRLREVWGEPLEVYDCVQSFAAELGERANKRWRPIAAKDNDFIFEALTRLHGRACLTASEVGALLRTGHATGANARWRTLHEIAVTATFISEQGQEVAERYLLHDAVACYKAGLQLRDHSERLGEEVDREEMARLKEATSELVKRFGTSFRGDWGWSAAALGKDRVTFADIAKKTDMSDWGPYVRMASHGIHAGPRGGYVDIGLPDGLLAIPARPSHFGLANPGANALLAVGQASAALLAHCLKKEQEEEVRITGREDEERGSAEAVIGLVEFGVREAEMKALWKLMDEGVRLFMEAHQKIKEARPFRSSKGPTLWEPKVEGLPRH